MTMKHPAIERAEIPPLAWFLLAAIIILSSCMIGGGIYLHHRQSIVEHRAETERKAMCGIFSHIPAGRDPNVDAARAAYNCGPPLSPGLFGPTPAPTVTVTPKSSHQPMVKPRIAKTVIVSSPMLMPTPGPTVTVTRHPKPSPAKHRHHRSPTPDPTCVAASLQMLCLPTKPSPLP